MARGLRRKVEKWQHKVRILRQHTKIGLLARKINIILLRIFFTKPYLYQTLVVSSSSASIFFSVVMPNLDNCLATSSRKAGSGYAFLSFSLLVGPNSVLCPKYKIQNQAFSKLLSNGALPIAGFHCTIASRDPFCTTKLKVKC